MKYAKSISATLAGALAVGMVPAMAFAADDDVQLELQTVESATAFQNGTIVAIDATGAAVDVTKAPEFTYKQGVAQYVLPTMVDIKVDGVADVPVDGVNATVTYYTETVISGADTETVGSTTVYKVEDTNVNGSQLEEIIAQGTYWVKVAGGANTVYANAEKWFSFEIVKPSLEDIKVYEVKADANDFSDMEFTYNGTNLSLALVADGDRVMVAHNDISNLGFCTDNGSGTYPAIGAVKTKGNYAFMVTAEADDNFKAGTVYIPFSVQALDLSQATLSLNAQKAGIAFDAESAIAGITGTGLKANLDGTYFNLVPKTTADTITAYTTPGAYTYVLSADKDSSGANAAEVVANVLNKQDVVVDVVSNLVALSDVTYNGKTLGAAKAFAGDLDSANTVLFDADLVAVKDGQNNVPFEIVVLDADGKPASIDDINTPGAWDVYVKADAEKSGYAYGGLVKIADVDFTGGAADADNVAFVHEGKIISNGYAVTYDGNDLLAEIVPSVKTDGGKTLVAGTDYDVVVTNSLSKVVTEMVNADTYTITLKSTKYPNINNQKISVVIDPIVLANPKITNLVDFDETEAGVDEGFPYTGKAIVPAVKYLSSNLDGTTPSKDDVWAPIPAEIFDFGFTNAANVKSAEMVKEGTYVITMTLKSGNYTFMDGNTPKASYTFLTAYDVVDEWLFVDVPSTAWFADEVRLATELEYMGGYYGGKNFGPYDSAKRQDVAVVIGRMAGVAADLDEEGSTSNIGGFESPFSDVVAGAYYARSVQWIDKAGIMTGYSANDEFGVNDDIKRQDLAVALYRYAQKYQRGFEAAEDVAGALAAYADGAEVSGYAKAAVAWAVEQGIMGVGTTALNPADDITRAELAAMITRLQPVAL